MQDDDQTTQTDETRRPGRPGVSDAVWRAVQRDFMNGVSGVECAARHGVGVSTLWLRAAREGWRRMDQPWPAPARGLELDDEGVLLEGRVDGDLDKVDLRELSWVAQRRMMRAAMRGEAAAALRWRRLRLALDQEADILERQGVHDEAMILTRTARARAARGAAGK